MLYQTKIIAVFGVLLLCVPSLAKLEPLAAARFAGIKKEKCALIHVWATWCDICIKEMPDLLKALDKEKRVRPYVVDVSTPFVQESFSKPFMGKFQTSFPTYLKPKGPDDVYMKSVDKDWNGGLPYSALYHQGVRKRVWNGSIDLTTFGATVTELCK